MSQQPTKLLTRRKAKWYGQRKPDAVRGKSLNYPAAVSSRYAEKMQRLVLQMTDKTESQIKRLFDTEHAEEFFAMDASVGSQARILTNALISKFDDLFGIYAKPFSERFLTEVDDASASSLHSSLKELSGGLSLKTDILTGPIQDVMKATVAENVNLIKSIPSKYLNSVQGAVMRSITTGNGLQDLIPFLAHRKTITLRRAQLIAADQTRKAYANLNRGRMEAVGLDEFEWIHSGGGNHPRHLHQQLNGKIFSFQNLPVIDLRTGERGIPGQLINCKCKMRPVIKFGTMNNAA